MIVPEELARVAYSAAEVLERRAVDHEDIHPAVVVVVKYGDAAAQRVHDVALIETSADQVEVQSTTRRDILKQDASNQTRRRFARSCRGTASGPARRLHRRNLRDARNSQGKDHDSGDHHL